MHFSPADMGKKLVLYLVTMLLSLTVHEFAHAFVADRLGDDTPRRQGRLTLSPLAHYDIWGTILIPVIAIITPGGIPFIGWARPVETNPQNYTRKISARSGHRLVAAAGPLSNLLLAVACMGLLAWMLRSGSLDSGGQTAAALATLMRAMVQINIGLCVLNFIPLPPLDGSRLLPRSFDDMQRAIAPYSFFILLVILNVGAFRRVFFWPVGVIEGALAALFGLDVGLA